MTTERGVAQRAGPGQESRGDPAAGRPRLLLPVILSATFMQFVDDSIVNVAIPSLQSGLRASSAAIELVVSVYLLAFSMTLITGARLGDIYGRRRLFLIGMAGFVIASAACGAAPTATVLIVARIFQGMFSGLMFPQVMSVIQASFAPEERGRVFGIVGAVIALATVLGPLLGGVLVAVNLAGLSWRLIFLVNVPIGAAALAGATRLLPESKAADAPRLDLPGAALATVGVGLLVYPLVEGREQGWPLWLDLLLAASVPVLAAFVLLQRRSSARALIRWSLFEQRPFVAGSLLSLVFYLGVVPFFFVLNIYLQRGLGFSALASGLTVLPIAIGAAAASSRSAAIANRIGRRILSLGAWLMGAGMAFVIATIGWTGNVPDGFELLPSFVLTGIGLGLVVGPLTNVVLAEVRPADIGSASGVLGTVQQLGGAVGIAVIGVLFFGPLGGGPLGGGPVGSGPLGGHARAGFSRAIQQALGYEIAVCLVSGLLVWALWRTRREPAEGERPPR